MVKRARIQCFSHKTQFKMTKKISTKGSKAAAVKKTGKVVEAVATEKTGKAGKAVALKKTVEHIQLTGQGIFDDGKYFRFEPGDSNFGVVKPFKGRGSIQMLSDGTVDVVRSIWKHSQSTLIKKLPHGRLSLTHDGAIQLTIKVFLGEKGKVGTVLATESVEAMCAYNDYEKANN